MTKTTVLYYSPGNTLYLTCHQPHWRAGEGKHLFWVVHVLNESLGSVKLEQDNPLYREMRISQSSWQEQQLPTAEKDEIFTVRNQEMMAIDAEISAALNINTASTDQTPKYKVFTYNARFLYYHRWLNKWRNEEHSVPDSRVRFITSAVIPCHSRAENIRSGSLQSKETESPTINPSQ